MKDQFLRCDREQNRMDKSDDDMRTLAVVILSDRIVVFTLLTPLATPEKQSQCRNTTLRICHEIAL